MWETTLGQLNWITTRWDYLSIANLFLVLCHLCTSYQNDDGYHVFPPQRLACVAGAGLNRSRVFRPARPSEVSHARKKCVSSLSLASYSRSCQAPAKQATNDLMLVRTRICSRICTIIQRPVNSYAFTSFWCKYVWISITFRHFIRNRAQFLLKVSLVIKNPRACYIMHGWMRHWYQFWIIRCSLKNGLVESTE